MRVLGCVTFAVLGLALAQAGSAAAFEPPRYMEPPAPIPQILDAPATPAVSLGPDRKSLAVFGRRTLPPIADLARPVLKLAGTRIDPVSNGPSEGRAGWLTSLSFIDVASGAEAASALPEGRRFLFPSWSPDGARVAIALENPAGQLELWLATRGEPAARRLSARPLNAAFGTPYTWAPDGASLLVRFTPEGRGAAPEPPRTPTGPIIDENEGRVAPARTFQDLLATPHDEALFVHYFTAELVRVSADDGAATPVAAPDLWIGVDPSPDGAHILATRLEAPFSRAVPASRFPQETIVMSASGDRVHQVVRRPAADDLPPAFDSVVTGPRSIGWRGDADATLVWAETQDGGDPATAVEVRDRVLMLPAPFDGPPTVLAELADRYAGVMWGRDDYAIVMARWWSSRTEKRFAVNPAAPGTATLLLERSWQDRFNDPGQPEMRTDARGQSLIHFTADGQSLLMSGQGATREGAFPFLDRAPLDGGPAERLWRAEAPFYESVIGVLDDAGAAFVTRRESESAPPNFHVRTREGSTRALTAFPDPAPQFAGISKRLVTYERADGVPLSGTLYTPPGYDAARDGPLPVVLWAYPTEFTDARVAGQVVDEGNRFTRPGGSSHLFLLTQGYAVFDDPKMPIVGQDGTEANDTYIEQLSAGAEAATRALIADGVGRAGCFAVGGHSYGAFMTANLLAHTDLFATGIARSGAYNRTLTPFGFQAEQRPYWQAIDTYTRMSPFTYADQIEEPILLIHGDADNNSGTFPVQTERFYAALKGNGATARYVVLPHEAHGYRGRESVGHTLWEMHRWLEQRLKPACAAAP